MIHRYQISNDPAAYEAFPDLVETKSGELICVFMECEHHGKRAKVRLDIAKSSDHGRTWSEKVPFTELSDGPYTYNCPRISRMPDDSLVIICDYIKVGSVYNRENSEQHVWYSHDDGKTWTEPRKLDIPGIVPDKYRVLSNGRHIVGAHRPNPVTKRLEQFAFYSDDNGETWTETLVASDERYNLCEVCIVEIKEGILVAFMRENSGLGYSCKKAFSYDYGTTWEGVYDTNIDGCHRPVADFYEDGKLFLTYRFIQGGGKRMIVNGISWKTGDSQNFFGAFFDTETALAKERTDHYVIIFPIAYDRNVTNSDTGYSGWVMFDDGEFYVVNYTVDDADKGQIRGYTFDITDVML